MTKTLGHAVAKDTAATRNGTKPRILTDVYGSRPPRGAEFGNGFSDLAGANAATDARRNAKPGQYRQ